MLNLHKTKLVLSYLSMTALLSCTTINMLEGALTWSSPANLSLPGKNAVSPQVSINTAGNATVVWSRSNGNNFVVEVTECLIGKPWTSPGRLSYIGESAFFAKIANDHANNSVAVWTRFNGTDWVVQAATKISHGLWSAPVNLSIPWAQKNNATTPQIAVDGEGNVNVVWSRNNGINNVIQSTQKIVSLPWSPPVNVTVAEHEGVGDIQPAVVVDPWGTTYAVWVNDSTSTIYGAKKSFGGTWSNPISLSSSGQRVLAPQLAVDVNGEASAVWSRFDGANYIVQTTSGSATTAILSPSDLSEAGQDAVNPQIAVDWMGNKVVVWQRFDGVNTIIQAAMQFVGGTWLSPVDISVAGQDATDPQVKIDGSGNIVAIWKRSDGINFVIEAATTFFGTTSAWSEPKALSSSGEDAVSPQLAVDRSGHAVVVWQRSDGSNSIIQAALGLPN